MPRRNIREVFKGEVDFYKSVLNEERHKTKLMAILDVANMNDFVPDIRTEEGKYADVVLYNHNEEAYLVLEFQLGFLDPIHASKITYYMHSQGVEVGVLIAEDVSEGVREYVKAMNELGLSIGIIKVSAYQDSNGTVDVDFDWLLRPFNRAEEESDNEPKEQRNKTLSRTNYPRHPRLLLAQTYYQEQYQTELTDYDHQCLGTYLVFGESTFLQMVFNSKRNSIELKIYGNFARNEAHCKKYETIMRENTAGFVYDDTSTDRRKCYRLTLPMDGTDEEQAKRTADLYREIEEIARGKVCI